MFWGMSCYFKILKMEKGRDMVYPFNWIGKFFLKDFI